MWADWAGFQAVGWAQVCPVHLPSFRSLHLPGEYSSVNGRYVRGVRETCDASEASAGEQNTINSARIPGGKASHTAKARRKVTYSSPKERGV